MRRLLALAGAAFLLAATSLAAPGLAGADGDPASDVLLGQDVFLPYSAISPSLERRLYAVAAAAGGPLPRSSYSEDVWLGASPASTRHALMAMLVLSALAALAMAGAVALRAR